MLNELWKYVGDIYTAVLIVGFLSGIVFYKRLNATGLYLWVYFGLMLLCQFASDYVGAVLKNNHIMLPIYCMVELGFFIVLFNRHMFEKDRFIPLATGGLAMGYIIYEFMDNFILHQVSIKDFQPYCKIADNFCVILYCLMFLFDKMKYNKARTEKYPLTLGLLVNFTLSSIFFLPFNFLVNQETGLTFYFWIGNAMMLVLYAGFLGFFILSPVFERKFSKVVN